MGKYKSIGIAFLRTSVIPPTAGFLSTWLVNKYGIHLKSAWVYTGVSMFIGGIYYLAFHLVEKLAVNPKVQKWAGIFLGYPAAPIYPVTNANKQG